MHWLGNADVHETVTIPSLIKVVKRWRPVSGPMAWMASFDSGCEPHDEIRLSDIMARLSRHCLLTHMDVHGKSEHTLCEWWDGRTQSRRFAVPL